MRTSVRVVFALTLLAICAVPAMADTITLTGVEGSSVNGQFVAPYYITVQSGAGTASYAAACDSYFNYVDIPETWSGTVNTAATLSQAKFGNVAGFDAVKAYTEASWLFGMFKGDPTAGTAAATNFAIWALFYPAYQLPVNAWDVNMFTVGFQQSGAQAWLDAANAWYNMASTEEQQAVLANLLIFTPSIGGNTSAGPQEFLTTVPEPASLALLAGGLLVLAGGIRRRRFAS